MLKEGWTIKIFEQQYEIVKSDKRWGDTLDWHNWIQTERMYNQYELNKKIAEEYNNKLNTGRRLLYILETEGESKLNELSEEEKQSLALRAVYEFRQEIHGERQRLTEQFVHEQKVKLRQEMSETKKYLRELSDDIKKRLLAMLMETELLKGKPEDWDKEYYVKDFHLFYPEIIQLQQKLGKTIIQIVNDL